MSNGDDVLDNWEEIDEAGINDKLQKIQAERKTQPNSLISISSKASTPSTSSTTITTHVNTDSKPMKLLQRTPIQESNSGNTSNNATGVKSPLDDMGAAFQPVMMVLHKPNDEYQSANYAQPINTQTVKILRRPTQNNEQRNNDMRPKQPIKTLQQREQEYAEARLRILGSAKNPEDEAGATNTNSAPTTVPMPATAATVATKVNSSPRQPQPQIQQLPAQMGNLYNNHYIYAQHQQLSPVLTQQQFQQSFFYQPPLQAQPQHQALQQQPPLTPAYNNRTLPVQQTSWSPIVGGSVSTSTMRNQSDNVIRLPRGPDGSGFQMRR